MTLDVRDEKQAVALARGAPNHFLYLAYGAVYVVMSIAVLAIFGWTFGLESLKRVVPNCGAMNPVTAVTLLFLSTSLALRLDGTRRCVACATTAIAGVSIGLARLWEYGSGYELGIDYLLFSAQTRAAASGPSGIGLLTAVCFVLSGSALLLLDWRTRAGWWPAQHLAVTSAFIAVLALLDVLYLIGDLQHLNPQGVMAVHTALATVLLNGAILFARPHFGLLSLLAGDTAEMRLMRRILLGVMIVPPVIGALRLLGERLDLYGTEFGVALTVTALMSVIGLIINHNVYALHRECQRRTQTESALVESRQRLTRAVKGSSDGLWDWDLTTDEVWYATRFKELLGFDEDEFPNRFEAWESRIHPADREATMNAICRHLEDGLPCDAEFRLRTKSGEYRWFRARGELVDSDVGRPTRMAGSIQDINALKLAERRIVCFATELARSNKDLEDFAYVASHDLRSPLRAISNLVGWIAADLDDRLDDENRDRMDLLLGRTRRLDRLIDDLLQYSRAGRSLGTVRLVDVGELVDDIVELGGQTARVEVTKLTSLPSFMTAAAPLEQVLHNLIDNAAKHHDRAHGRLTISARDAGEFYEFSLSDDGPGIAQQYHERVFHLFETLKPRDVVEGSGMGLAIVKRTVEHVGGVVRLDPNSGRGTTIRFTWPKALNRESDPNVESDGSSNETAELVTAAV